MRTTLFTDNIHFNKHTNIIWHADNFIHGQYFNYVIIVNDFVHRPPFDLIKRTIIVWFVDDFVYRQHFDFNKTCYYRKVPKDRSLSLYCLKVMGTIFLGFYLLELYVLYDSWTILSWATFNTHIYKIMWFRRSFFICVK